MIYKIESAKTLYRYDYVMPVVKAGIPNSDNKNANIKKDNNNSNYKRSKLTDKEKAILFKGLLDESIEEIKRFDNQKTK